MIYRSSIVLRLAIAAVGLSPTLEVQVHRSAERFSFAFSFLPRFDFYIQSQFLFQYFYERWKNPFEFFVNRTDKVLFSGPCLKVAPFSPKLVGFCLMPFCNLLTYFSYGFHGCNIHNFLEFGKWK